MCGIAGILGGSDIEDRRLRVERMTGSLVHRGPDDEGYFDDDLLTPGFRRLAVIDLETGQEPIVLPERRLVADVPLRWRLAEGGRRTVEDRFSLDVVSPKLVRLLDDLIDRQRMGGGESAPG